MGHVELDAHDMEYQLTSVYFSGVMSVLTIGLIALLASTAKFVKNLGKMPTLVKTFGCVLAHDWFLVLNYLARDGRNLQTGKLDTSSWCTFTGFVAIFTIIALRVYFAIAAYATYR